MNLWTENWYVLMYINSIYYRFDSSRFQCIARASLTSTQRYTSHHLNEFLKYSQFSLQALTHEQCSSIEQEELTSFSVVQNGIQMLSCSFHSHPYSTGLGRLISFLKHLSQMNADTRIVLLTCWTSAAWVGGIRSRDTSLWVNKWTYCV